MYPHPYDMVPARPIDPPDLPWKCSDCGNTCEAWRCEICCELHCGYDQSGPVVVHTLRDGVKKACADCVDVNIYDCLVRDLGQARQILKDLQSTASYFEGIEDLEEHETPYALLGHAMQYIDRQIAEARGIPYTDLVMEMLQESLKALKKPVDAEAHDYAAVHKERFGEVSHA